MYPPNGLHRRSVVRLELSPASGRRPFVRCCRGRVRWLMRHTSTLIVCRDVVVEAVPNFPGGWAH